MKKLAMVGVVAMLIVGCTHPMIVQIEDLDGRGRQYDLYSDWTHEGEVWQCKQVTAGKMRASYSCESMLLR